jgi:hypothetical protein
MQHDLKILPKFQQALVSYNVAILVRKNIDQYQKQRWQAVVNPGRLEMMTSQP